mmetsp:Transcript_3865/g.5154  ORF Transcript_3865/g.5154 Transcript_3865/m.5154 type:complete len:104 (-) Transcript_3865:19-330(-)
MEQHDRKVPPIKPDSEEGHCHEDQELQLELVMEWRSEQDRDLAEHLQDDVLDSSGRPRRLLHDRDLSHSAKECLAGVLYLFILNELSAEVAVVESLGRVGLRC